MINEELYIYMQSRGLASVGLPYVAFPFLNHPTSSGHCQATPQTPAMSNTKD